MTMKLKATLAAAAMLIALPAAAQQAGTNSGSVGTFADSSAFQYTDGKALFESSCQGCHQAGGVGAVGAGRYPALAKNPNLESPGYPIMLILHGQKAMPPLGGYFDDAQVAAIVNYIRSNFGNAWPADEVTAQDVTDLR
jgi:mono/diheme cytochrome c family protein